MIDIVPIMASIPAKCVWECTDLHPGFSLVGEWVDKLAWTLTKQELVEFFDEFYGLEEGDQTYSAMDERPLKCHLLVLLCEHITDLENEKGNI